MKKSKHDKIRTMILSGKKITPMIALQRFGVFRLASVINRLRKEGISIDTVIKYANGDQYAEYCLTK